MEYLHAETLVLLAALSWAFSGVPALLRRDLERDFSTPLGWLGSGLACLAGILGLAGSGRAPLSIPWPVVYGTPSISVDPLSAVFLFPVALIAAVGAGYGRSYWSGASHADSGPVLRFWYGLLTAALLFVMTASHGLLFLGAWEVMAISAFFLVSLEHDKVEVRTAGWVYLVAAHVGGLFLFAMTALLGVRNGSYEWSISPLGASPLDGWIFGCGLIGFAFKSGIAPFHFWLPGAHANAPSHVSAMLSGVLLKTGVYGILRLSMMIPIRENQATLVLLLGAFSAIYGISMALAQADYKRTLAYSSIEHLGIIFLAVGLALLGRARGEPSIVVFGLTAALLHVWNHAVFKSLLFLGAGAVLHGTGTRLMDRLGGLWPRMPRTAAAMLVGVVAAAGLPPLNGFASEWLLYLGLFATLKGSGGLSWAGSVGVPVLALVGGLALATFAKFFGTVFLGSPRTQAGAETHEPAAGMWGSLWFLAGACFAAAIASPLLVQALGPVVSAWAPALHGDVQQLAPMLWVSGASVVVVLAGIAGTSVLSGRIEKLGETRNVTWDCGYDAPTPRMQYTGRSFSGWLAGSLQPAWTRVSLSGEQAEGYFPASARFGSEAPDPFKERWYRKNLDRIARWSEAIRRLQAGILNLYLLYILVTLLVLFAWIVWRPGELP